MATPLILIAAPNAKIDGALSWATVVHTPVAGKKLTIISPQLITPVTNASRAGIPVVIFDSELDTTEYVSLIETDNYKGGRMAGDGATTRETTRMVGARNAFGRIGKILLVAAVLLWPVAAGQWLLDMVSRAGGVLIWPFPELPPWLAILAAAVALGAMTRWRHAAALGLTGVAALLVCRLALLAAVAAWFFDARIKLPRVTDHVELLVLADQSASMGPAGQELVRQWIDRAESAASERGGWTATRPMGAVGGRTTPLAETIREAGLNKYLFDLADIREQCSWCHKGQNEAATKKAIQIVKMSVAKSRLQEPLKTDSVGVTPACLVIGGGIAGLAATYELRRRGVNVLLVESGERLGGVIRTDRFDGWVIDGGPDALLTQKRAGEPIKPGPCVTAIPSMSS